MNDWLWQGIISSVIGSFIFWVLMFVGKYLASKRSNYNNGKTFVESNSFIVLFWLFFLTINLVPPLYFDDQVTNYVVSQFFELSPLIGEEFQSYCEKYSLIYNVIFYLISVLIWCFVWLTVMAVILKCIEQAKILQK